MRVALFVMAVAVVVGAEVPDAEACTCADFNEDEATKNADVIFDGWVISTYPPPICPVPPAPKPKAGCVRIAVVNANDCTIGPTMMGLEVVGNGDRITETPKLDDDASTFCTVKAGKYIVRAGESYVGDDDGTTRYGRAIQLVPGSSYVLFSATSDRKGRVGVARVLKGEVPREVDVFSPSGCCTGFLRPGEGNRFFATRGEDGKLNISGMRRRELDESERSEIIKAPALAAAGSAAAPVVAAKPAKKSGGCATSTPTSASLAVLGLLALRRRRR